MIYDLENEAVSMDRLISAPNVATLLDEVTRNRIAAAVVEGYENDKQSRADWQVANANAMAMALQVVKQKTEPWVGASNIKFPLVAVASIHYHARAYPLLIDNNDLVKCVVYGMDPTGEKSARATRLSKHMTWQCFEEVVEWEEEHDKLFFIKAILGVAYSKQWFSPELRRNRAICVSPADFVVNYWTRGDVNEAPRATHVMEYTSNDVRAKVLRGSWLDYDNGQAYCYGSGIVTDSPMVQVRDKRTGIQPPQADETKPAQMLEQMTWMDLDGDGFCEPYFVTVQYDEGSSQKLRRIVARWTDKDVTYLNPDKKTGILNIKPEKTYTKYGLIPAPDGSHMDLGFGRLLGPINAAVDTALNQLFDAGTIANYGGGFLGRGARFKGGQYQFTPGKWVAVDVPGNDLKNNIVPVPAPEPSQIMFQLIGFLVNYGERLASAGDVQVGENVGQNTKVGTAEMMNENGQRTFKGMFKRAWRSLRNGFRIQYDLNSVYLTETVNFADIATGEGALVSPEDYKVPSTTVRPAADPTVVSEGEKKQQADLIMALGQKFPGNQRKQLERILRAYNIPAPDEVFPPPQSKDGQPADYPTPPSVEMLELQIKQAAQKLDEQRFKVEAADLMQRLQSDLKAAQAEFYKDYTAAIKNLAMAKGVDEGNMVGLLQVAVSAYEKRLTGVLKGVDAVIKNMGVGNVGTTGPSGAAGVVDEGGMAAPPDNGAAVALPA